jgi:hypothetical protein
MNPVQRRLLIIVIVALIFAAGTWKWQHRELASSLLDFVPVDADHVAVVRRDARAATETAFEDSYVELLTSSSRLWRSTLPQTLDLAVGSGLSDNTVVTGDVLVVRTLYKDGRGERPRLQGVRGEDGKLLWTALPMTGKPSDPNDYRALAASLLVVGSRVIAFFGEGTERGDTTVVAYEPESGREVWRAHLPAALTQQPVWVRGSLLLVSGHDGTELFDAETGQVRGHLASGNASPLCVLGDVAWTFGSGEIRELTFGNLTQRTLPGPAAQVEIEGPCGARGTNVWLLAKQKDGEAETHFLLALDRTSGAEVARIALGPKALYPSTLDWEAAISSPDDRVLSGELPRFVPRLVPVSQDKARLWMIDLDERKIAWKSAEREDLARADQTFLREGKQYLLLRTTGVDLAAATFASDTGAFIAATECTGCRMMKLTADRIWWSDDWAIASLDPRSLVATPFLEKLDLHDTTEAMRAALAPTSDP